MNRPHTFSSIARETSREKRTIQLWLQKHREKTGQDLGEKGADGTRYFSDGERDTLLRYGAISEVKVEELIQSGEAVATQQVDLMLPESFNPVVAVTHFDGAIGLATEPEQIVELASAMLRAAENVIDSKLVEQRQQVKRHEDAAAQLRELKSDKLTDIKIKASESRQLAERQTSATTELQALLAKIAELGKSEP